MLTLRLPALAVTLALCACTSPNALLVCESGSDVCVALNTAGTLARVNLNKSAVTPTDNSIDADASMRVIGDEVFVLQRTSGTLRIYDSRALTLKVELPVGDDAHPAATAKPRDFWINGSDIWVSASGNPAPASLVILDRDKPGTVQYIGLPLDPTDTDGNPEADKLYSCNYKLYVTMKGIRPDGTYTQGRFAIVSYDKRTVSAIVMLAGTNPYDMEYIAGDCNDVVVSSAGDLSAAPDGTGAIERFNLDHGSSQGIFANDVRLGGRPTFVATSGSRLYVATSVDATTQKLVLYSIKDRTLVGDVTGALPAIDFVYHHDGKIFLGAGALYIAPDDITTLTTAPIDTGSTPVAIALP